MVVGFCFIGGFPVKLAKFSGKPLVAFSGKIVYRWQYE